MAQQGMGGFSSERFRAGGKLFGDLFAATFTATVIAPSVTLIDRALVEKASSNKPIVSGLRAHTLAAFKKPGQLFLGRPFAANWSLYAATFAVANSGETATKEFAIAAGGTITLISTLAVNVPLGVWKDIQFARFYGASPGAGSAADKLAQTALKARPRLPKAATSAFLVRDALTIYGSFALPHRLAALIPDDLAGPHAKATMTQMTAPVLSQLVATPVHLLGLNLYDHPGQVSIRERAAWVWRGLAATTAVRCVRIIPAFCIGCLTNLEVRSFFHGALEAA